MRIAATFLLCAAATVLAGERTVTVIMKDGNRVTGVMDLQPFELETGQGKVTPPLDGIRTIDLVGEGINVTNFDGTFIQGTPSAATWSVKSSFGEFTLDPKQVASIVFEPAARRSGEPQQPGGAVDVPQEPELGLPVLGKIGVKGSMGGLALSTDGKLLYAMDATGKRILEIDCASFETRKEIPLSGGAVRMTMASNRKAIVATVGKRITVVDLSTSTVSKSFEIEHEMLDVCSPDGQTVYANSEQGLLIVSVPKQAIVEMDTRHRGGGFLGLRPDGLKLLNRSGVYLLPKDAKGKMAFRPFLDSLAMYGSCLVTADGRFLIGSWGGVYRLGHSPVAELVPVTKLDVHTALVVLPEGKALFLILRDGSLKRFGFPSCEWEKSWLLEVGVGFAAADESSKVLYLFAGDKSNFLFGTKLGPDGSMPAGDLYKIAIPE